MIHSEKNIKMEDYNNFLVIFLPGTFSPEKTLNDLGYLLIEKKQFSAALTVFGENIRKYPKSFRAYLGLGEVYLLKGDKKKARETIKKALEIKPGDPNALGFLEKAKTN